MLSEDKAKRFFFSKAQSPPSGPGPPHYRVSMITLRHTTLGRTSLDEWSARRRDLYLTTHNTHQRQTFMPTVGFEPTVPANERLQTDAIDRAATGTGEALITWLNSCFERPERWSSVAIANGDVWSWFQIVQQFFTNKFAESKACGCNKCRKWTTVDNWNFS